MALNYDSGTTSTTDLTAALDADTSISDITKTAIESLITGSTVTVASWNGTDTSTSQTDPNVVIADIAGNAGDSVSLNLPDAAVSSAKTWIFNSDADLNLTLLTSADDPVIVGGNGNDTITTLGDGAMLVEGGAGNDSVTTAGGNDTIVAGDGNDTVNTGDGYDTVQLAGSASDYTFSVTDGVLTATHSTTTTATATAGDTTTTTTTVTVDSTTTITNAEILTFGDDSDSTVALVGTEAEAEVVRLYETLFDRSADASGADYWLTQLDAGTSLDDIATYMMSSSEYTGSDLSDAQFVEALYENSFGRAGDYEGVSFWLNELSNGTTRAEVVADFASSQEAQDASVDVMPVLIVGTDSSAS